MSSFDEEHAVLLIPGWRHRKSGKLHIRRDCRAVMYHSAAMSPVLCRFDDRNEAAKLLHDSDKLCRYCFPTDMEEEES